MIWRILVITILLATAAGGCLGKEQGQKPGSSDGITSSRSGSSTMTSTETSDACLGQAPPSTCDQSSKQVHIVEMLECSAYFTSAPADSEKVAAYLPQGYAMDSTPASLVVASAWICASAVVDNSTVIQDFQMFYTGLQVEVPPEVASEGRDSYYFEQCTNSPVVNDLLAAAGFEVCDGSLVATKTGPSLHLVHSIAGVPVYDISVGLYEQSAVYVPSSIRGHQENSGQRAFYDRHGDTATIAVGAGGIVVSGGFLADVLVATEHAPVNLGINIGDQTLEIPLQPTIPE